jgi:D-alanyl-D-alanine carboxypeptidase
MKNTDRREGGKVYLWSGEKVSVKDLFYLSLVASGNSETMALVNSTGLGEELFVKKMNEKAKELGLKNTVFLDPVGLNEGNVSTAREVAKFARTALAKQEIAKAVTTDKYRCATKAGRKIAVSSTDELLGDKIDQGLDLDGGKTGYNGRAGYCFVGKFTNAENHPLISVILGEATKKSRFSETMDLVKWAYDSHAWPEKMN